ncbi:epidermal growth factor-like protein 7 isoform X1 [Acinonyx jubatus]|uniref:Epidermal growth factor-like protein 7 isoform X1 n=1 Tax=Acinonyx jubatus TaxID=32536 RepID=A0ABM3NLM7_ACIJB|nr:epidermal growth factor-like protein 7 isoform X1 [Acinonyx jubatus]XP_053060327.1 epidermal growth factor-like protein 7 isoform X1 [Acinonyx jubatus]
MKAGGTTPWAPGADSGPLLEGCWLPVLPVVCIFTVRTHVCSRLGGGHLGGLVMGDPRGLSLPFAHLLGGQLRPRVSGTNEVPLGSVELVLREGHRDTSEGSDLVRVRWEAFCWALRDVTRSDVTFTNLPKNRGGGQGYPVGRGGGQPGKKHGGLDQNVAVAGGTCSEGTARGVYGNEGRGKGGILGLRPEQRWTGRRKALVTRLARCPSASSRLSRPLLGARSTLSGGCRDRKLSGEGSQELLADLCHAPLPDRHAQGRPQHEGGTGSPRHPEERLPHEPRG